MPIPSSQTYYCRIRNCQRTCGLLHRDSSKKRPLFGQKAVSLDRDDETKSEETNKPHENSNTPSKQKKRTKRKAHSHRLVTTNLTSSASIGVPTRKSQTKQSPSPQSALFTFEEIMERAARKVSTVKINDKPTSLPLSKLNDVFEKRLRLAPSVSLDTTTIHFDQPVWDNPQLREELLDSEEEFALDVFPPSLQEDSIIVDEIISEATHAKDYNPIDHDRKDEMISGWSSDENDYSNVDLTQVHRPDSSSATVMALRKRRVKGITYEESLDVLDN